MKKVGKKVIFDNINMEFDFTLDDMLNHFDVDDFKFQNGNLLNADKSINLGLNSLIFLRTNSYAFRYSSEVVPAGKGILKILLYLPLSFSVPVPG